MNRTEEYLPDGKPIYATPTEVVACWRKYTTNIPAQYALGTADHESSFALNEIDTEPSGYVSMGIFQLGDEEMASTGFPLSRKAGSPVYTLEGSTRMMVRLCEHRLERISHAMNWSPPVPDLWFFLALAHNEGLGACLKTLAAHGMNAAAWIDRNPSLRHMAQYGMDCITGGKHWSEVDPAPFA
jgi:hypothetical protein